MDYTKLKNEQLIKVLSDLITNVHPLEVVSRRSIKKVYSSQIAVLSCEDDRQKIIVTLSKKGISIALFDANFLVNISEQIHYNLKCRIVEHCLE